MKATVPNESNVKLQRFNFQVEKMERNWWKLKFKMRPGFGYLSVVRAAKQLWKPYLAVALENYSRRRPQESKTATRRTPRDDCCASLFGRRPRSSPPRWLFSDQKIPKSLSLCDETLFLSVWLKSEEFGVRSSIHCLRIWGFLSSVKSFITKGCHSGWNGRQLQRSIFNRILTLGWLIYPTATSLFPIPPYL